MSMNLFTKKKEDPMKDISVIGIDIAKSVFHIAGMDRFGKLLFEKRVRRGEFH